jgi:hypothetical protein
MTFIMLHIHAHDPAISTLRVEIAFFEDILYMELLNWFFKYFVHTFRTRNEIKKCYSCFGRVFEFMFPCSRLLPQWSTEVVTLDVA